ncbi:MAG: formylglycine-generating enzyme family protein [Kiritimatiellia bacterium]
MKTKVVLIGMMAVFVSMRVMAAEPTISGVMVQQRRPWSRLVDIDYVLTCEEQLMDITVSAYNGDDPLDVPETSFSGDFYNAQRGAGRIVWDPMKTAYTNDASLSEFRVVLTPKLVPLYMIIDLTKSVGETGQTEYVYEVDLTNGLWGAWVRNPVTNDVTVIQSVIWTGVTTNDIYKTDKLVLRRIPAGAFLMGSSTAVTLSRGFYAGVYQVTQEQWEKTMGSNPSYFKYPSNPVNFVEYNDIRGATNSVPSIDWPWTGASVLSSSFIGQIRDKTGFIGFDLPTAAQLEYIIRAGTTTTFNNGKIGGDSLDHMNELGWCKQNSDNTIHPVGQKAPNAWGLYDTHGNVREWCLDWYSATIAGGVDPVGPESDIWRVHGGGCYNIYSWVCGSTSRGKDPPTYKTNNLGLRLVMVLP